MLRADKDAGVVEEGVARVADGAGDAVGSEVGLGQTVRDGAAVGGEEVGRVAGGAEGGIEAEGAAGHRVSAREALEGLVGTDVGY